MPSKVKACDAGTPEPPEEATTAVLPAVTTVEYAVPDDASAPALYAELMSQDLTRWPWAKARAELAYGTWLHRQRRDAESVGVLDSALAAFDRIGATVWADRARAGLTAALAGQPSSGNHQIHPAGP